MVAGVLFDVDGTLVDTTYLHTVAWAEALRQQDSAIPMAEIHRALGMGSDKLLDYLLGPAHQVDDAEAKATHSAVFGEYRERLGAFPEARQLLRRCADTGLKVGLATSASAQDVAALRATLNADQWLSTITGAADADRSKPDPDILEAALDRMDLDPSDVVFVGDAIWDIKAAEKLGIECIAVECGGTSRAELEAAGAIAVYRDPADLLENFDDSPLVRR